MNKKITLTLIAGLSLMTLACLDSLKAKAEEVANKVLSDPELRKAALAKLSEALPEDLAVASNTAADSSSYTGKVEKAKGAFNFLGDSVAGATAAKCFDFPAKPQTATVECYGPTLKYIAKKHPDYDSAKTDMLAMVNGDTAMLPPGDLGIWSEKEKNNEACAAAKLNALTTNAAYYVDLAMSTMRMMICVSAFKKDTTLAGNGAVNAKNFIDELSGGKINVNEALIQKTDKKFVTRFAGNLNGDTLDITLNHNATDKKGIMKLVVVKAPNSGMPNPNQPVKKAGANDPKPGPGPGGMSNMPQVEAISVAYQTDASGAMSYRLIKATHNVSSNVKSTISGAFDNDGEAVVDPSKWSNDFNIMVSKMDKSGYGDVAYGWQAGAGDQYLRVFNVSTKSDGTGKAWFGYSANGLSGGKSKISDALGIDGVICNWAGPGAQKKVTDFVQSQTISKNGTVWIPTASKIKYAPTNSCETTVNTGSLITLTEPWPNDMESKTNYSFTVPSITVP